MAHWWGRGGEGVKRPPPLSLPPPSPPIQEKKTIGAEQTNQMAIKHYSPLLHWDFVQTTFYWSLQCAHTHMQQTHSKSELTHASTQMHTLLSPPISMTVVLQVPTV